MSSETATLAGGCFWCLESLFARVSGVSSVVSGYIGGQQQRPSYEAVCTGSTGHAEAVQIRFDPRLVSYRELLDIFFTLHDPTTLNRQGHDVGSQYRSAIFWHSQTQKAEAERFIAGLSEARAYASPIVTEIVEATCFWPAEDYHQGYYDNHSEQPYCQAVIAPKLAKLQHLFGKQLKH
jgi:peptide-methionine (S)-S-oxide reductase